MTVGVNGALELAELGLKLLNCGLLGWLGLKLGCWKLLGLLGCKGCKGCTTCGWFVYTPPPPPIPPPTPSPPPSLSDSVPVTLLRPSTDPPSLSESQLSVCLFRSLRVKADCRSEARCSGGFHLQEPLPSVLGGFTTGLCDLDSGWASTRTILPLLSKPESTTQ